MCCLPCCWTYDFTPALSNSWKALGWIDLTTKFRCKLFKPHVPWSQTDGICQSHLVQRKTNGIRCVLTIPVQHHGVLPTSYGGPSQAFFMAWSTKGFWCDRRFCLGILFSRKDLCIYIYTHYTVCNYKMCMCIVYYRYMVRIDDRSNFFQSHGKSQRSSRLSLLEATKKFPWNNWSSWNPKSVTRDEA